MRDCERSSSKGHGAKYLGKQLFDKLTVGLAISAALATARAKNRMDGTVEVEVPGRSKGELHVRTQKKQEERGGRLQVVKNDVWIWLSFRQLLRRNWGAEAAPLAVNAVSKCGFEERKCAVNTHLEFVFDINMQRSTS